MSHPYETSLIRWGIVGRAERGRAVRRVFEDPRRRAWSVCIVATLTMSVSYIDRQTLAALSPTVVRALAMSEVEYGSLTSAFAMARTGVRATRRLGRRSHRGAKGPDRRGARLVGDRRGARMGDIVRRPLCPSPRPRRSGSAFVSRRRADDPAHAARVRAHSGIRAPLHRKHRRRDDCGSARDRDDALVVVAPGVRRHGPRRAPVASSLDAGDVAREDT